MDNISQPQATNVVHYTAGLWAGGAGLPLVLNTEMAVVAGTEQDCQRQIHSDFYQICSLMQGMVGKILLLKETFEFQPSKKELGKLSWICNRLTLPLPTMLSQPLLSIFHLPSLLLRKCEPKSCPSNLEPVIQSEVSQKEKSKYLILTDIYGI